MRYMSKRDFLKEIANDTISILQKGEYKNRNGQLVSISDASTRSIQKTIAYSPKDTTDLLSRVKQNPVHNTHFIVTNETTLEAVKRLKDKGEQQVAVLNFASAKHPGGGFLKGSSAQEESLARSSALFYSLSSKPEMYEYNLKLRTSRYSDYMIYSPDVPVFKNDKGELLDEPYLASFITSPAVNKGAILQNERNISQSIIDTDMRKRIEKIIALAIYHQHDVLVLGAFGCGVFKNNPKDVAKYFKEVLNHPKYKGQFKEVVFAVYDSSEHKSALRAFEQTFSL